MKNFFEVLSSRLSIPKHLMAWKIKQKKMPSGNNEEKNLNMEYSVIPEHHHNICMYWNVSWTRQNGREKKLK